MNENEKYPTAFMCIVILAIMIIGIAAFNLGIWVSNKVFPPQPTPTASVEQKVCVMSSGHEVCENADGRDMWVVAKDLYQEFNPPAQQPQGEILATSTEMKTWSCECKENEGESCLYQKASAITPYVVTSTENYSDCTLQ